MTEEQKEWQEELRMEAQEERNEDRRYANRSAEDILEDIADDFSGVYGDLLEDAYRKLQGWLSDYGLECSSNDIFEQVLEDNTQFTSPYADDNRSLRKRLKLTEFHLGLYKNKFGLLEVDEV